MTETVIVAVFEDGTTAQNPLHEWIEANFEDADCMALLPRLQAGEIITAGGGAQPLCRLWLERNGRSLFADIVDPRGRLNLDERGLMRTPRGRQIEADRRSYERN
jgi:hypothetical protein